MAHKTSSPHTGAGGLRALRLERGLTQRQLAGRAGLNQSTVSMIEQGQLWPKPATIGALAAPLGVEAGELCLRIARQVLGREEAR